MTHFASASSAPQQLDLFFCHYGDSWLVYLSPSCTSPLLAPFFDREGEARLPYLDFEDLDRFMQARGVRYEKRVSKLGSVQLLAEGEAADALVQWLLTAFSSGIRRPSRPAR